MSYKPNYDELTKGYNDTLNLLSGGNFTPLKRKAEHQKEMAAYHNKTSNSGIVQGQTTAVPDTTQNQEKSSFEQWNIEKTQPQMLEIEKEIISLSPFGVKPYWQTDNVDKQRESTYNKGTYGNAQS